jgi:hypothetical protein
MSYHILMEHKSLFRSQYLFIFVLLFSALPLIDAQANMSSVANGQTITVNAHGTCYKITNNGGSTAMVPWQTSSEWSYFINYRPGHLALSNCITERQPATGHYYLGAERGGYNPTFVRQIYANHPSPGWYFYWEGSYIAGPIGSYAPVTVGGWTYELEGSYGGYYGQNDYGIYRYR